MTASGVLDRLVVRSQDTGNGYGRLTARQISAFHGSCPMEITLNQSVQLMHAKVFESLKAWAGYEALEAAIRECSGVSVYLAGGAVRDLMRFDGRKPKDFDFFLAGAGIERFLECLSIAGDLRVGPFGSPRWFPQGAPDRYADVVPIARFYNGLWSCKDIVDALNQFDFTA